MRGLLMILGLLGLLTVGSVTSAEARPAVAVAPLEGDEDNQVAEVIAEVLAEDATVTGPKPTGKAIAKLGVSGELTNKDRKALRKKLEVDALVEGKLEKDGKKKKLQLVVSTSKMKKSQRVTVDFKSAASNKFRTEVRDELVKRIGVDEGGSDDDEDAPKKVAKNDDADDAPKKKVKAKDDGDEAADEAPKRSKKKRKASRDDDDDGEAVEDRADDDGDAPTRHVVNQRAVRVNLGGGFGVRTLTWTASGMNAPPRLGTPAPSARLEAELYPLATESLGGAAGLGIYGEYDKTLGVSVAVPNTMASVAIDQAYYGIGARYRLAFGTSTLAFGAAYVKRHYIADRSTLAQPAAFDAPDVVYTAVAPGAIVRIGAGPKVGISLEANALLMFDAGPIVTSMEYGAANILAFETAAGVDIALSPSIALRFAGELTQIGFSFRGKGMSTARGVTAATDRQFGGAASLSILY